MNNFRRLTATNLWRSGCLIDQETHTTICKKNVILKTFTGIFAGGNKRSISTDGLEDHDRAYIPRRTLMYVPGHDTKKLKKIPGFQVDCAILECEDGVAVNMKAEARKNIREALDYLEVHNIDLAFRVNSRSSGLMEADLGAVIGHDLGSLAAVTRLPKTILLPKVDTVDDIIVFTERLQSLKFGRDYRPYLLTYVESAQGLINMNDILSKARDFSKDGVYQLDGVIFGSDDFLADIGAERTSDAKEVIYARQKIVMIAKAYRLQAIDMVSVDIHDHESLRVQSEEGARLGYTGKQVIHPGQLPIVEAAFTPSQARIEWATELVKGFEEHQKTGKGAFTFRGQMIDMPLLLQAKNVLRIVKNVNKKI
ncbi:unnamed protein product [Candidula unifasciata]|uniref:Citramalyl-CoA lyase, mitochondrial n=1 Tax=Candidula unifasciata TaxID=100452 RepID=A0A8S3ZZ94_9EUPU|nr:unnamed protein product [Candidula unifasciata]